MKSNMSRRYPAGNVRRTDNGNGLMYPGELHLRNDLVLLALPTLGPGRHRKLVQVPKSELPERKPKFRRKK